MFPFLVCLQVKYPASPFPCFCFPCFCFALPQGFSFFSKVLFCSARGFHFYVIVLLCPRCPYPAAPPTRASVSPKRHTPRTGSKTTLHPTRSPGKQLLPVAPRCPKPWRRRTAPPRPRGSHLIWMRYPGCIISDVIDMMRWCGKEARNQNMWCKVAQAAPKRLRPCHCGSSSGCSCRFP